MGESYLDVICMNAETVVLLMKFMPDNVLPACYVSLLWWTWKKLVRNLFPVQIAKRFVIQYTNVRMNDYAMIVERLCNHRWTIMQSSLNDYAIIVERLCNHRWTINERLPRHIHYPWIFVPNLILLNIIEITVIYH